MGGGSWKWVSVILLFIILSSIASAYVHSPNTFQTGSPLQIQVSKLWSTKTQLSYDYNYCKPQDNRGEVLPADRINNFIYTFHMREEQPRTVACRIYLDAESSNNFKEKIDDEYQVHMILDNLPLLRRRSSSSSLRRDMDSTTVEHGFHLGFKLNIMGTKQDKYFINNHLSFRVLYHREPETNYARIVGFEVTPSSITHKESDENPQLALGSQNTEFGYSILPQVVENDREVVFTYDVSFKESDIKWASRWDTYLLMNDNINHWLSVMSSMLYVFLLSGMVNMIMFKTVHRDVAKNNWDMEEEILEETGWKIIHGDVFRVPESPGFLCVYVGSGVQIFATTLVTIICGLLGFLSPIDLRGCITAMVTVWIFMGLVAGYSSARLYKMLKGKHPKKVALCTSFFVSGMLFAVFFTLNSLIRVEKSPRTVSSGTVFAFVCLWFGVSVPLVFLGSYLGFKRPPIENPVKTSRIPSQVPYQPWYMRPVISALIGGSITFGAISAELYFILTSIWLNRFYYNFFFIFILFVVLVATCAETTVILCYYQLCSEDYKWWWRAYNTAGSSALYLYLGSIYYFFTKLRITKLVPSIMYFGYMSAASYAFYVLMGTIGFYACLWFVQKIYSSAKIN